MMDRVESVWKELGNELQATGTRMLVRTFPLPTKSHGGVYLPGSKTRFYGELRGLNQMIVGTVLSFGPKVKGIEVGDNVCFARLYFTRHRQLEDKTMVGWVESEWVFGVVDEEPGETTSLSLW